MAGLGAFIFFILLILLVCGGFSIYFVFKQVQFIIQSVNLYKKILGREDAIIKLLMDIRDNTKTFSGISSVTEEPDGGEVRSNDPFLSREIEERKKAAEEYRKRSSVNTKGIEKTDQCKKCGARLPEGAAFCADCGNKLG
jgi:ribosomal protein L40E